MRRRIVFFTLAILIVLQVSCASNTDDSINPEITKQTSSNPININTADEAELQRLPGIGPKTAAKIVAHRRLYGAFQSPAELMLVEGIGEKQFLKMKNLIRT